MSSLGCIRTITTKLPRHPDEDKISLSLFGVHSGCNGQTGAYIHSGLLFCNQSGSET